MEILVALSVMTVGMIGVASLVVQNIRAQGINQNNLVAAVLAQEGLEIARNIRDQNWVDITLGNLDVGDWSQALVGAANPATMTVDFDTDNILNPPDQAINAIDNAPLYIDANGMYTHTNTGNQSPFYRLITVDEVSSEFLIVSCLVRWQGRGDNHDYTAETFLYDWR